jgi:hypothetical protein
VADKPAKSLRDTRKAPPYMRWYRYAGRSTVLYACIPLKTRKPCLRTLGTADPELARINIVAVIKKLIAAGQLDRQSQVAKLYLDRTISEDEIERGTPNSKTPPCMIWGDGTDLADGQLWQHRTKGVVSRVLQSQIYLTDGSMLRVCLNTADPKLAAKRLRPHVLKAIAEGKLRPDSKAARIYGGAETAETIPPSAGAAALKRGRGQPPKWKDRDGPTADGMGVYNLVEPALETRGPNLPSTGQIKKAIAKVRPQLPPWAQGLSTDTIRRQFSEIRKWLAENPGRFQTGRVFHGIPARASIR